mmetsp:Transcript_9950/g.45455  ORF Transcript_9950/g.45455 Transcript_9950/m.45455 type:complete len:417 (-) Transcript_9950:6027-7277(-)
MVIRRCEAHLGDDPAVVGGFDLVVTGAAALVLVLVLVVLVGLILALIFFVLFLILSGVRLVGGAGLGLLVVVLLHRGSLVVLFLTLLLAVFAVLVLLLLVLLVPHLLVDDLGVLVVGVAHLLVDVVAVVVLLVVVVVLLLVAVGEVLGVSLEIVLHLDPLGLFLLVAVGTLALVLLLLLHILHAHDLLLVLDLVADVLLTLALAHAGAALVVHELAAVLAVLATFAVLAGVAKTLGADTHDERRHHSLELGAGPVEAEVLGERAPDRLADQREHGRELRDASRGNRRGGGGVLGVGGGGCGGGVDDIREGRGYVGEVVLETGEPPGSHRAGEGLLSVGHGGQFFLLLLIVAGVHAFVVFRWTVRGGFDVLSPHQRGRGGRLHRLGQPRRSLRDARLHVRRRVNLGVDERSRVSGVG